MSKLVLKISSQGGLETGLPGILTLKGPSQDLESQRIFKKNYKRLPNRMDML